MGLAVYRIADLNIEIKNKYAYTDVFCEKYKVDFSGTPDITAYAHENDMDKERKNLSEMKEGYLESLAIYRDISRKILDFGGFILHASIIEKDGVGYAFSAKSGTGKTTHSRLWLEKYPDAKIINGDKPLVRIKDDAVYAYGTPWCGKEGYNVNEKVPLKALCFLERAEQNSVSALSKEEAVKRIFSQLVIPESPLLLNKMLDLIEIFIEKVPACLLLCNMDLTAAQTAYEFMSELR